MVIFWMILGLVLLVAGAEVLVRGASNLATTWGISPLIVGLTVVAFGTSSPELAVSLQSVASGQAGIAMGNVVGSNIFNVLFILGLSALIAPLVVSRQLIRLDVPIMIGASVLVLIFSQNGSFSRWEGGLLFAGLVCYLVFLIVQGKREGRAEEVLQGYGLDFESDSPDSDTAKLGDKARLGDTGRLGDKDRPSDTAKLSIQGKDTPIKKPLHWSLNLGMVLVGLGLLVQGSNWLVEGAVHLAAYFGVSEVIVGLTMVAAGTSLPEVVTSVMASLKGERDIAVGNVVGSNVFNLLGVLGLTSFLAPGGIQVSASFSGFDVPIMVLVAFACLPIFFSGGVISRWEGAVLFGYYVIYTAYLVMASAHHDALPLVSSTLFYFVIPLTLLTLVVIAFRSKEVQKELENRHV